MASSDTPNSSIVSTCPSRTNHGKKNLHSIFECRFLMHLPELAPDQREGLYCPNPRMARSRGPRHARFSRDGVASRGPRHARFSRDGVASAYAGTASPTQKNPTSVVTDVGSI